MLKNYWYRLLSQLLVFLYYHRVRVLNAHLLPNSGPVLFVALHRNGAVDGYVYKSLLPRSSFLISVQLRRSWIGRLFFGGIEVARSKDRTSGKSPETKDNTAVIDSGAEYIRHRTRNADTGSDERSRRAGKAEQRPAGKSGWQERVGGDIGLIQEELICRQ